MAKLYFYYSAMNAGKSTILLQSNYNYRERGMNTLVLTPEIDSRCVRGSVTSRIGLSADAIRFNQVENLLQLFQTMNQQSFVNCVLVDESQFLTTAQVKQLSDVADVHDTPVLAYGLRTDFQGKLFEGSRQLLAWADNLVEIKIICHCGHKATMVLRLDHAGIPVREGAQIKIVGNERYLSVCRRHFKEGVSTRRENELPFD